MPHQKTNDKQEAGSRKQAVLSLPPASCRRSSDNLKNACILCPDAQVHVMIPRDVIANWIAVLKCTSCGLVFLESRAKTGERDREEDLYWDDEKQKKIYLEEKVQKTFRDEFESRLDSIEKLLPRRGNILDVGCGVGHFLARARDRGWTVQGLDISKTASTAAREAYGLDVKVATLAESPFEPETFDAVSLWDVIEHIRTPLQDLKAVHRILKPGGILVMKTPNEDSLYKSLARIAYRMLKKKGSFLLKYVYYVPHYFSYSEKTMNRLLERCGFQPEGYEWDATPQPFAVKKIHAHYAKDPKRFWVVQGLPAAEWLSKILRKSNKMTVYAKKVKSQE